MDKLLERCAKHRQATRGRKTKRTRSPLRNTSKIKQHATATTPAPETLHQTTNQSNKVSKIESSGHASTTKHAKNFQQAQAALEPRSIKPDGTPKNPDHNPVMKHSTITPDTVDSSDTPKRTVYVEPGTPPTPGALTTVPSTEKTESKTGEKKKGLMPAGALTPAKESASSANKLSQAQRSHIYQLIGAGYRNTTILAHIRHNLGVKVRQSISEMRHRQPDRVEQGRREIAKEIGLAAPIADKIHRIAKRQELVNSLERKLWRVTSVTKGGTRLLTGTHETINRILDSVKAELEPYEVNVSVDLRGKTFTPKLCLICAKIVVFRYPAPIS